ncbi:MAG: TetR/AcrR family transcriptional regulator [Lachnospiraceae bacterium]|nr:TetR/AcrR family transcriptional regulator [Lachnospiraceae bacterium]
MGEKSVQKKQYIVETARKVFMEKGYKNVTMKDIVEACEISRGGLYLYFDSTAEIFLEVLKMEAEEKDDVFSENVTEETMVTDILLMFLKEQKKELLRRKNNLTIASYEFFFENNKKKDIREEYPKRKFEQAVESLAALVEAGIQSGEFYEVDAETMARNIMFLIEGMRVSSQTMGISEEAVDREFAYIVQNLVIEEE